MIFIAEVKTQSPYGFKSNKSWDELFEIANKVGDWISIHVEPEWGGSRDLIHKAKKLTNKRILAKGIHKTDEEIIASRNAGADCVLVVGRKCSNINFNCIIEPNTIDELIDLTKLSLPYEVGVVWNKRDLKTGKIKKETFSEARRAWPGWLCQASMITSYADIDQRAEAVLVGEHLESVSRELIMRNLLL